MVKNSVFKGAIVGLVCSMAAIVGPAKADLMIYVNNSQVANQVGNTSVSYSGNVGDWDISTKAFGATGLGNTSDLFDISNLNVSTNGTGGTLNLKFVETNLTGAAVDQFLSQFSGTLNNVSVTRTFYLDLANAGGQSILLGTTTLANAQFLSALLNTGALFSLTEVITLNPTGPGAKLSGDDDVMRVPEPGSLALLGTGLLGLGLVRRRKKTA
jgi:hypothetical protein